jgi:exonuclease 1
MALALGVTPYMVFDGDFLPSKAATEQSRAQRREESRKIGLELLKAGKPAHAHLELQKAIDITPEMARHLIDHLRRAKIPYIVAPYEADAQLVYLERQGIISGIITEDSDLLVFGAKRLLTKMDQHGQCIEVNRADFGACRGVALTGWTDADFRRMAILSGCDYLEGIPGVGLKTAYRMMRKYKTVERVVRMVQFEGKHKVAPGYLELFRQAELTFMYQRVFCPKTKQLVLLTEADPIVDISTMPYIGAEMEVSLARGIAAGDVNPITKEIISTPAPLAVVPFPAQLRQPVQQAAPSTKSIDSYFDHSRRKPLAPMNPNCFSADLRRVASLTNNGQRPIVFPLPRPYLAEELAATTSESTRPRVRRRVTEPIGHLLGDVAGVRSAEPRRRTAGSSILGDLSETNASLHPPKKARLCEELVVDAIATTPEKKSRFFGDPTKLATNKTNNAALVGLPAADTIEATLLSLPNAEHWNTPAPKTPAISVFEDVTAARVEIAASETVNTASAAIVPETEEVEVPASSPSRPLPEICASPPVEPAASSEHKAVIPQSPPPATNPIRGKLSKLAYGLPTPSTTSSSVLSSRPSGVRTNSSKSTPATGFSTPLQRIGANALRKKPSPSWKTFTPPLSNKAQRNSAGSCSSFLVNPSFVPLPRVDLDEVEVLNRPLGSEDQIGPLSDDENDSASPVIGGVKASDDKRTSGDPRLDLSRFLYA